MKRASTDNFTTEVYYGIRFVAGKLEFSLTALPIELLYTLQLFAAAKKGDLNEVKHIIESSRSSEFVVPYVVVSPTENTNAKHFSTISVASNQGIDINTEYQAPTHSDEAFLCPSFNRRRSSVHMVRNVTLLSPLSPITAGSGGSVGQGGGSCSPEEHKLLLHIAIEKNHLEMVIYLLSQNANVSNTHAHITI